MKHIETLGSNKMIKSLLITIPTAILLTGCSFSLSNTEKKCNPLGQGKFSCNETETSNDRNKSIIFTKEVREDEIVDYGQYAEIWIAPYKYKRGSLFNGRTLNIWIEKPSFKIGEDLVYETGSKSISDNTIGTKFNFNKTYFKDNNEKSLKIELDENIKKILEEE